MAEKETLYCEIGNHKWKRDKTRGRKPTHCAKHKPAVTVARQSGEQTLVCAIGGHEWKRPAQRGKKPIYCPTHKPAAPERRVTEKGTVTKLHCEIGNHDWERPATRGRAPRNCPEHKPQVQTTSSNASGTRTLWCEIGKHNWERPATRGRAPINCDLHKPDGKDHRGPNEVELKEYPDGSAMTVVLDEDFFKSLPVPEKPAGKTDAEKAEEKKARSLEIVDTLEAHLRERGTHISQNPDPSTKYGASVIASPYVLFRKVSEDKVRDTTEWEMIEHHSPLQKEKWINTHEAEFAAGNYRYERGGIPVEV